MSEVTLYSPGGGLFLMSEATLYSPEGGLFLMCEVTLNSPEAAAARSPEPHAPRRLL